MWRIRRRPRKRPLPFQHVFIISFIIFSLLTAQALWLVNKGIEPALMEIAETETADMAQLAIQSAVKNRIVDTGNTDGLINVTLDNEGKVARVSTDPKVVNEVQSLATANVQSLLEQIERGKRPDFANFAGIEVNREDEYSNGIFTEIPLGRATNNALLANLGPNIPVRFRIIGSVESYFYESTKTAGINTVHLQGWIEVIVKTQIVVPFETKEKVITTNVMLVSELIPQDVPYYYHKGDSSTGAQPVIPINPQIDIENKNNDDNNQENSNEAEKKKEENTN
ncbi:sporulation protein YunB [Bacillus sp. Marseille-Q3570]|uniref:sporulation protein YunB n=1 Tax=Bacillus sp. Marseille-Q3570 TaxID=2963522 RepID=UPI0021B7D1CD|nr:sporulation protein YunB [Bacillus sp. Marseille-Q3570]